MIVCRKPGTAPGPQLTCADLSTGDSARVVAVLTPDGHPDRRLSSLGVVRDAVIQVLQTRPCFVIRCDETEFAVEESLARTILVRR